MSAQNSKVKWRHPISLSLLDSYKDEIGIIEIIDREIESLLRSLRERKSEIFSDGGVCTPIEKIIRALDINLVSTKHSKSLGTTKHNGAKFQVTINTEAQHYFRQRFTLAHELGHICLNQLAGPFTYHELAQTKNSHYEEEFLCDLFASAILMPKSAIKKYLESDESISLNTINRIASDFKVSKSAALRRLACIKDSLLLFWSETENPLTEGSEKAERIMFIYPNLYQLSKYYIPLYCTANDMRFQPNLIVESLEKEKSNSGSVQIRDLGSLPAGNYYLHNIFFKRWSKDVAYSEQVGRLQRPYDMATLIELKNN